MNLSIQLYNPQQAETAWREAWPNVKAQLTAGKRLQLTIKTRTRSLDQNALLHAAISDIANQLEWHGKKLDALVWKRLCVAAWLRENKQTPDLVPALDGNGFDVIYEKTSKLSITQCSELLEWCFAFGVDHGVKFRAVEKNG